VQLLMNMNELRSMEMVDKEISNVIRMFYGDLDDYNGGIGEAVRETSNGSNHYIDINIKANQMKHLIDFFVHSVNAGRDGTIKFHFVYEKNGKKILRSIGWEREYV